MAGIVCLIASAICVFVAVERYQANADSVRAMQSSPLRAMLGGGDLEPATPAATKYALLFATLFGGAGIAMLVKSGNTRS
jgi:hypothetical protein